MANFTRRTLAPLALLVGVAACESLPKETHWAPVKPVRTAADPAVAGADGYYAAAVSAITRRDYAKALDLLQEADARKPGDVRVNNAFGVVYDKLGRFDLSARYYALAQAADSGSTVVAGNMAYSAALQGRALAAAAALTPLATRQAPPAEPKPGLPPRAAVRLAAVAPGQPLLTAPAVVATVPATTPLAPPRPGLLDRVAVQLARLAQGQPLLRPPTAEPAAPIRLAAAAPGVVRLEGVAEARAPRRLPLLAGRGLEIADASGLRGGADPVRLELTRHGWSAQAPHAAAAAPHSSIYYPPAKAAIAQGLARTLPFKVQLAACADCRAVRLTIGRDSLRWTAHARSLQTRRL